MDLKEFSSTLTLSLANSPVELGEVFERYDSFMRDFSNLVMVSQVNSLIEADQDSIKSAFIGKWFEYIQLMQKFKANMNVSTTIDRTLTSADEYAVAECEFAAFAVNTTGLWFYNSYGPNFDLAALNALIDTPVNYTNYFIFYYPNKTSGNQYLVYKVANAVFEVDTTHTEILVADVTYEMGTGMAAAFQNLIQTEEEIPVEVDLLSEYYPIYDQLVADRKSVV